MPCLGSAQSAAIVAMLLAVHLRKQENSKEELALELVNTPNADLR